MALAATILDVIEVAPGPGTPYPYSWISKAKATGMNKHLIWMIALFLWRIFK